MENFDLDCQNFRNYLSGLIDEKKLSISELAEETGVTRNAISSFLNGQTKSPQLLNAVALIRYLSGSIDEPFGLGRKQIDKEELHSEHKNDIAKKIDISSQNVFMHETVEQYTKIHDHECKVYENRIRAQSIWITILTVLFIAASIGLIIILVDCMNPNIGTYMPR